MLPLQDLPDADLARMEGLFLDIDDTLTTDGRLPAHAYAALEALHDTGLRVVPITGRPAGWCDHFARMWPVDAVVGENGAFYFWHDHEAKKLRQRFLADEATRAANAEHLKVVAAEVLRAVPGCALASDQFCRIADIAIDFCEDVPALPPGEVERIAMLMRAAGMTAKISSIHVNGWFGDYDKLSMARLLMRERYGIDLDSARQRYLFIGDSPNDEPMFGYFPQAVGVANVADFAAGMTHPPAYVTGGRGGDGFVELAQRLLAVRR
jgi:HAD superfamily hydrolase (TIGR01484 family)